MPRCATGYRIRVFTTEIEERDRSAVGRTSKRWAAPIEHGRLMSALAASAQCGRVAMIVVHRFILNGPLLKSWWRQKRVAGSRHLVSRRRASVSAGGRQTQGECELLKCIR